MLIYYTFYYNITKWSFKTKYYQRITILKFIYLNLIEKNATNFH